MGVLSDLVPKAQPALFGGGCTGEATEGATWQFPFEDVTNNAGTAINLTTVTGACVVTDGVDGATVATLTFTGGALGTFTLNLDESATAGTAGSATKKPRRCNWSLRLTDGTDVVQAWGPSNSSFYISAGS